MRTLTFGALKFNDLKPGLAFVDNSMRFSYPPQGIWVLDDINPSKDPANGVVPKVALFEINQDADHDLEGDFVDDRELAPSLEWAMRQIEALKRNSQINQRASFFSWPMIVKYFSFNPKLTAENGFYPVYRLEDSYMDDGAAVFDLDTLEDRKLDPVKVHVSEDGDTLTLLEDPLPPTDHAESPPETPAKKGDGEKKRPNPVFLSVIDGGKGKKGKQD